MLQERRQEVAGVLPEIGRRAVVLLLIVVLSAVAILAQLGNLTMRERAKLVSLIPVNQTKQFTVDAPRGDIYDRNGTPLALNRPASAVYINYPHYTDAAVLELLARTLNLDLNDLKLKAQRRVEQGPIWEPLRVKSDISADEYARLLEAHNDLPGVVVEVEAVRQYPQGPHAAHIVGYVGAIGQNEWSQLKGQGYQPDDIVGKMGLEAFYESQLRGTPGVNQVALDPRWRPIGVPTRVVEPVQGNRLNLTLDLKLQEAAERALAWTIFRINAIGQHTHNGRSTESHPARAGALVVIDVNTGAILAMASHPTFDPNLFITRRPADEFERTLTDPLAPLWNRAIRGRYFPGSTWKPLVATAALTEKEVTAGEIIFSGQVYEPTGQHELAAGGLGPVNLRRALQRSSNIYFYELGRRLGIDRMERYARLFGFGERTGIDLPEEDPGFVPDAAWRQKHGWYLGNTTSAAIGQWFEVTPVQIARYVAAIANGGKVLRPYLVQSIVSPNGQIIQETRPQVVNELGVSQQVLNLVIDGMKAVDAPGGTSGFAQFPLPGLVTAGKTGTAQVQGKSDYGVYIGFAPADQPEIAAVALIEEGGHGSWVAPAVRAVYSAYFNLPLDPKDPARVPPEFPEKAEEIAKTLRLTGGYISPSN